MLVWEVDMWLMDGFGWTYEGAEGCDYGAWFEWHRV